MRVGGTNVIQPGIAPSTGSDKGAKEAKDSADDQGYPPAIERDTIKGLDGEGLKDLGEKIHQMIGDGRRARSSGGRDEMVKSWRDMFNLVPPRHTGRPWPTSANLRTPTSRTAVETVLARLIDILFATPPYLTVTPHDMLDLPTARKWVEFAMADFGPAHMNLRLRMIKALKSALVDGLQVGKTCWKHEVRRKTRRARIDAALLNQLKIPVPSSSEEFPLVRIDGKKYRMGDRYEVKEEVVVQNRFDLQFVDFQDFVMFPAKAPTIDSAGLVAHRVLKSIHQLRYGIKDGMYDPKQFKVMMDAHPRPEGNGDLDNPGTLMESEDDEMVARDPSTEIDRYGYLSLYEGYLSYDVDSTGDDADDEGLVEDVLFTIEMSTKTILRFQVNPYHNGKRPMRDMTPDPRIANRFYGYSQVEKLHDLQLEDEAITNQLLDAGTLALSCIIEQDAATRRGIKDTPFHPGVMQRRIDRDGKISQILEFPKIPQGNFVNRDDIRRMAEKVSTASEAAQGAASASPRPLGETNLQVSAGAIRLNLFVISIMDFLTWVYQQFFDYNQQFMDEERTYVIKEDGKEVSRSITLDDLNVAMDVSAYCAAIDPDKTLSKQFAEKAFTAQSMSPFVQSDLARVWEVLREYLVQLGVSDIESKIGTREEAERLQARLAQHQDQNPPQDPNAKPQQAPPPDPHVQAGLDLQKLNAQNQGKMELAALNNKFKIGQMLLERRLPAISGSFKMGPHSTLLAEAAAGFPEGPENQPLPVAPREEAAMNRQEAEKNRKAVKSNGSRTGNSGRR